MGQGVHVFDRAIPSANIWLREVMHELDCGERLALRALEAVLHALRDRLPLNASAHLAAQLPRLLRGIYFERWRPQPEPLRVRRREEFLAAVAAHAQPGDVDPARAVDGVFEVLARRLSPGQVEGILRVLPEPLRWLFPGGGARAEGEHTVGRFMVRDLRWVVPEDPVPLAVERMASGWTRHVLVMRHRLVERPVPLSAVAGIVSTWDLTCLVDSPRAGAPLSVAEVMTPAPLRDVEPAAPLSRAAELMRREGLHALLVRAGGHVVGLLTDDELLEALVFGREGALGEAHP
ncbi:MAG: DUF2267 domain-containing protein [Planctomycetota bacterium]